LLRQKRAESAWRRRQFTPGAAHSGDQADAPLKIIALRRLRAHRNPALDISGVRLCDLDEFRVICEQSLECLKRLFGFDACE
jgi:hypothetical protein